MKTNKLKCSLVASFMVISLRSETQCMEKKGRLEENWVWDGKKVSLILDYAEKDEIEAAKIGFDNQSHEIDEEWVICGKSEPAILAGYSYGVSSPGENTPLIYPKARKEVKSGEKGALKEEVRGLRREKEVLKEKLRRKKKTLEEEKRKLAEYQNRLREAEENARKIGKQKKPAPLFSSNAGVRPLNFDDNAPPSSLIHVKRAGEEPLTAAQEEFRERHDAQKIGRDLWSALGKNDKLAEVLREAINEYSMDTNLELYNYTAKAYRLIVNNTEQRAVNYE